jgi:hypothetical protein
MKAHHSILIRNVRSMYYALIISVFLVITAVSVLLSVQSKKQCSLSIGLFSFKFKYLGGSLVIISIFLSLFELMEDEFYNNIRIVIANFGLIIIALSKDKLELRDISSIKIVCFSLSTFISYLVYSLMAILSKVEETVELSWFILDLLVIYLISYHYIKSKLSKGV